MTWLVTGGAGYIGAHVVARLHRVGVPVVVVDDMSTGLLTRLPVGIPIEVVSVGDRHLISKIMRDHQIRGVVHLAGHKSVPESVATPMRYYRENIGGLTALLEAMVEADVHRIVFASSAAVYGVPEIYAVSEQAPTKPISPYGRTKLTCEQLLADASAAYGISFIALRFFNVVGADGLALADRDSPNLFSRIFSSILHNETTVVTGADFPTPDGTAVRDYVHVADLADAHARSIERLEESPVAEIYNVGTGTGYSVFDVLAQVRAETSLVVPIRIDPARIGDPPSVIAAIGKIATDLNWSAQHDLVSMIASTWRAYRYERQDGNLGRVS